ncbi:hypothetical protein V8E55_008398 [Tylopilus felleus]
MYNPATFFFLFPYLVIPLSPFCPTFIFYPNFFFVFMSVHPLHPRFAPRFVGFLVTPETLALRYIEFKLYFHGVRRGDAPREWNLSQPLVQYDCCSKWRRSTLDFPHQYVSFHDPCYTPAVRLWI